MTIAFLPGCRTRPALLGAAAFVLTLHSLSAIAATSANPSGSATTGDALATDAAAASPALAEMSLEELASMHVTTATRRDDRLNEIPAAVWVITQDDIRRSGAINVPEVLRLAPGLHVAQIDETTWAISARGFNSRFSNKLLVLVDGRTIYSPAFGGVWWGPQTMPMDDIERIEVIRGPGGALWGANAVNGVINIITKRASQTAGFRATGEYGIGSGASASARFGGSAAGGDWRVYVKHSDFDGSPSGIDGGDDGWRQSQAGFRYDRGDEADTLFTLTADAYAHTAHHDYLLPAVGYTGPREDELSGASLLARWQQTAEAGGTLTAQAYVDHTSFDGPYFAQTQTMLDADVQYALAPAGRHRALWGASARLSRDHLPNTPFVRITKPRDTATLLSAFLQDDYSLRPDQLVLTAGVKVEHHDEAGTSLMPNLRLRWRVDDASTAWAAVSRAVRQPGRGEIDWHLTSPNPVGSIALPTGASLPLYTALHGNAGLGIESVLTAELGWRRTWQDFTLDVALYQSRYRKLRELDVIDLSCMPSGTSVFVNPACLFASTGVVSHAQFVNSGSARARGGEIAASWQVAPAWRLNANYSYLVERTQTSLGLTGTPTNYEPARHIAQLRSSLYLGNGVDWDVAGRYVGAVHQFVSTASIPAYVEVSSRLAWRPTPRLELALIGLNLLRPSHLEQISELQDLAASQAERSAYLQVRWSY